MDSSPEYLYEENHEIGSFTAWMIVIGLSLFLVASGIFVHRLLPERERHWDYGALDTIPGASIYSSTAPQPGRVGPAETEKIPTQIAPRPGARPLEKLEPIGYQREE